MFRRQEKIELDGAVVVGSPDERWSIARPWVITLLLVAFTGLYFYLGRHLINQTNGDRNRSDQQNNIRLTKIAHDYMRPKFRAQGSEALWRWFPHYTDGVVNPLWPWIAARAIGDKDSDEQIFVRGKWLNLSITCGVLLLGAGLAATVLSLPATLNALLLIGLGAFLPRAVWFQPEPLYFVLFLFAWLAAIAALLKTSLVRYLLVGLAVGVAYLAKASALPLLICFLGMGTLRWLWAGMRSFWKRGHGDADAGWCPRAHLVGSVICVLAFLLSAGPRLNFAHQQFGSAFHNFPAYWMWMDDFETEGKAFMVAHNTREKLQAIPKEERPSFSKYLADHGTEDFRQRLSDGAALTVRDFLFPKRAKVRNDGPDPWRVLLPDRGFYLFVLLAMLLLLWLWSLIGKPRPESRLQRLAPEATTALLFVIGTFALYLALYGWYRPVGKGDRFMLSLYAPLVLTLVWAADSIRSCIVSRRGPRAVSWAYFGCHLALAMVILLRVFQLSRYPGFFTK